MTNFADRIVLVTGGANGMGEATAHTFAKAGATVVIADFDTERSPLVESEIRAGGGDAHAIITDIREPAEVAALVDEIARRWGRVDVVHNNAASLELTTSDKDVLGTDPQLLLDTLRGNVFSMFLVTRAVLPLMLAKGAGSIINVASVSGLAGELQLTAYGISKAAVVQFTRAVSVQYGKRGIRCNAIAPALVKTRNVEKYGTPEAADIYVRNMSTPFAAEPQDVANVVFFLGSDEARLVTGHVIPVDGGLSDSSPIAADYRDWLNSAGR
jgi:NAD(P)-dependent dehydrogenase (short-subunit alcohol dehydrogenase family)